MKSIVTKYEDICAFTGKPAEAVHHLIFGVDRQKADEDGLVVPVTNACHNMGYTSVKGRGAKSSGTMIIHGNSMAEAMSKMIGQLAWEKQWYKDRAGEHGDADSARDAFMKRYGRSFL